MSATNGGFFESVYALVRRIPRGRVATYGQVAALVGVPRGARAVGWALRGIGERAAAVPWHRVVGRGGRIALDGRLSGQLQRRRLRREGVRFVRGCVDLDRHGVLGGATQYPRKRVNPRRRAGAGGSRERAAGRGAR